MAGGQVNAACQARTARLSQAKGGWPGHEQSCNWTACLQQRCCSGQCTEVLRGKVFHTQAHRAPIVGAASPTPPTLPPFAAPSRMPLLLALQGACWAASALQMRRPMKAPTRT